MTVHPTPATDPGRRHGEEGGTREAFAGAAGGFVALVRQVAPDQWDRPALGSWDVRGLVGHASRSLSLLRHYVEAVPDDAAIEVDGPVAYYRLALGDPADEPARRQRDADIAERGRDAGIAFGPDPAKAVQDAAAAALALVDATPDGAPIATAAGVMTLIGYLPTRTFELTVHGLDLAAALHLAAPTELAPAVAACCTLAGGLAAQRADAADLLRLLCGRATVRADLSVL